MHLAQRALNETNMAQNIVIGNVEHLLDKAKRFEQAQEEMAVTVPDIAWQASTLHHQIMDSASAINLLMEASKREQVHIPALTKIFDYVDTYRNESMGVLKSLQTEHTTFEGITRISDNTFLFQF